jgi:fructose-bisphosphate aldolase class II
MNAGVGTLSGETMRPLREILAEADKKKVAVGHFNFSELVVLQAVAEAARELRLPVVMGVSESEREFLGVRRSAALVRELRENEGLEIFLNADHTHSIEKAVEAARAGFDMIVFDASQKPLEENIALTRRGVEAAKSIAPKILVEGEVGYIGSGSEIHENRSAGIRLTEPDEAKDFVAATKVDLLSPSVGNMHGLLPSMVRGAEHKRLDIARIAAIKKAVALPLTLHGGSGTDDDDFRRAIAAGIGMIHINTELRMAWRRGLDEALKNDADSVVPYKLLPRVIEKVKAVVASRLKLFNGIA